MSSPTSSPLPSITGTSTRRISILLINPNSTASMTTSCLDSLATTLPPSCTITGFTAPHPSPTAIESATDAVLSTAACLRALPPILAATRYDAFLVACFSHHPLIDALREELADGAPVIGIMEAALYAARMLGGRLGIVCTGERSRVMHEDAIRHYGLERFSAGVVSTGLGVLDLHRLPREEVVGRAAAAARVLVEERGADVVLMACAGFTSMVKGCAEAVEGKGAVVVDGVTVGVQMLVGLVREGLTTGRAGVYRSSADGRRKRGQEWL